VILQTILHRPHTLINTTCLYVCCAIFCRIRCAFYFYVDTLCRGRDTGHGATPTTDPFRRLCLCPCFTVSLMCPVRFFHLLRLAEWVFGCWQPCAHGQIVLLTAMQMTSTKYECASWSSVWRTESSSSLTLPGCANVVAITATINDCFQTLPTGIALYTARRSQKYNRFCFFNQSINQ